MAFKFNPFTGTFDLVVSAPVAFLDLTDVDPSTYSGQAGKVVAVNVGEDGLEFISASGVGTVTSVDMSVPTGFTVSGNPITAAGTLAVAFDTGYQGYTTVEASKLSGIEAGADVTDATNVDAAGAVMNSDTSTASMSFVIDEDDMSSDSATKVPTQQSVKAYVDSSITDISYDTATGAVSALGNLGATEAIDWSTATHFTGTLDADVTITHSNEISGQKITIILSYDGSAQRTITWSDVDVWLDNSDGSAPTSPSGSGEVLVVTLVYVGTTCYGTATGNYGVYA